MTESAKSTKIKVPALLFAILAFCAILISPVFQNYEPRAALALLVLVATLWITEAIPLALTGLLVPFIAILMRLSEPENAFGSFAHPILFLFMGGFVLAGALSRHSLDKWMAHRLISMAKGNFYKSSVLLMLATALTACWVTNTSAAAMMVPMGIGLLALAKRNEISPESKFLMLGIAYSANIGGIITMVASPPNAMGAAILKLSFSEWTQITLPLFAIVFPVMVILLTVCFRPDRSMTIGARAFADEKIAVNKTLVAIFTLTVALWALDSFLSPLMNITSSFSSVVAILCILLLFLSRVMKWNEILKSIRWEILLLFGGGLTLGMIIETSGLGMLIVNEASTLITKVPLWMFLWIVVMFGIILTEFMSNTASAALVLPLLYSMAGHLQLNPMLLVFPATIAASFGFMMPVGTPPNAMVFGTGLVPRVSMLRAGLLMNLISSVIVTAFFYVVFR